MPDESDSCSRAAQAAIEVVREECGGMDVEIREMDDNTFIEIPTEDAQMMASAGNSPVPLSNYEDVIDQSSFLRDWLGGRASSGGVDPDPMDERFASVVHNLSGAIFDDPLGFDPEDLLGTDALEAVSRAA
ncbi:hypothetical protein [uncultured Halorubrum sp.]|uniref:hypothetical protein n=1 Tax=uncultured Halorubrum sp. TaxID=399555 RepID=UPI00260ED6B1|nr:hypothetical protein [uncultured Halorubrum sp.]